MNSEDGRQKSETRMGQETRLVSRVPLVAVGNSPLQKLVNFCRGNIKTMSQYSFLREIRVL